jgi:23S rRNA (guanine745-N1)-methyltransferase
VYRCPVCAAPLRSDGRSYRCQSQHVFDIAREGYVNLRTGRTARRRSGGDDPTMVRARRAFLDAGHYARLRDAVLVRVRPGRVLDLGCGEGYYSRPLPTTGRRWVGAVDLSRTAVALAARREPSIEYAVANAFDMPMEDGRLTSIINVFGPVAVAEMLRLLSTDGLLVLVAPGPAHLIELKSLVLDQVQEHPLSGPRTLNANFELVEQHRLSYEMDLAHPDLDALLTMTPYRWRVRPDRAVRLSTLESLRVTADFLVFVYRPR